MCLPVLLLLSPALMAVLSLMEWSAHRPTMLLGGWQAASIAWISLLCQRERGKSERERREGKIKRASQKKKKRDRGREIKRKQETERRTGRVGQKMGEKENNISAN